MMYEIDIDFRINKCFDLHENFLEHSVYVFNGFISDKLMTGVGFSIYIVKCFTILAFNEFLEEGFIKSHITLMV